ncbi:hypothetical protein NDU88_000251 [Pleurodeles waltl]|uniref:Uncharacterized protein n=1 Tax=Pleurodeles waltl TaxID=8319 RepID=A0AAV7P377_PLEWA|nr:hypothetical protein NDU88_000251 [Pleurodeles waltl]
MRRAQTLSGADTDTLTCAEHRHYPARTQIHSPAQSTDTIRRGHRYTHLRRAQTLSGTDTDTLTCAEHRHYPRGSDLRLEPGYSHTHRARTAHAQSTDTLTGCGLRMRKARILPEAERARRAWSLSHDGRKRKKYTGQQTCVFARSLSPQTFGTFRRSFETNTHA